MAALLVNGGKCKHYATFERKTTSASDFEDTPEVWEQVCEAYVSLEHTGGNETTEAQQMTERVSYKATFRYSADGAALRSGDRMIVGSRTFHLTSVVNVNERNHWLEAMAVETRG